MLTKRICKTDKIGKNCAFHLISVLCEIPVLKRMKSQSEISRFARCDILRRCRKVILLLRSSDILSAFFAARSAISLGDSRIKLRNNITRRRRIELKKPRRTARFFLSMGYEKDGFAFLIDGFELKCSS